VTVKYESWNDGRPWRVSTAAERRAAGLEQYVARLVEVRTERDRREREIGFSEYIQLRSSPGADLPWPAVDRKAVRS
jgi:hypothetical protein